MSSAAILAQIPGITKLPLHQITILDATLCGRMPSHDAHLIVPIPKNKSFELIEIPCKIKMEWDKNINKLKEFDAAIEKFIGHVINRHEKTRYIHPITQSKEIPIILYYIKEKNEERLLCSMECFIRSPEEKAVLEQFTKYYFEKNKIQYKKL
jgi:hypothetical protein